MEERNEDEILKSDLVKDMILGDQPEQKEYRNRVLFYFMDYEIRTSLLGPLLKYDYVSDLASYYFAWKVKRKYTKYRNSWEKQHAAEARYMEFLKNEAAKKGE